jgi:hypothetical protein
MNELSFLGKKIIKPLSAAEVAKLIGISRTKLFEYLREKNIVFKKNNRNIPTDLYIRKGWVEPKQSEINNEGFEGIVVTTVFTKKGFEQIRNDILLNHFDLIHTLTYENFWYIVNKKIKSKLKNVIEFKDGEFSDMMRKNSLIFTDYQTGDKTVFYYHNSEKIHLLKFNPDKKIIYG